MTLQYHVRYPNPIGWEWGIQTRIDRLAVHEVVIKRVASITTIIEIKPRLITPSSEVLRYYVNN